MKILTENKNKSYDYIITRHVTEILEIADYYEGEWNLISITYDSINENYTAFFKRCNHKN